MGDIEGEAVGVYPARGVNLWLAVDLEVQLVLAIVYLPPLSGTLE
jgi:hypothetical protein